MSYFDDPNTLAECRTYEKKFPLAPTEGWSIYKQYSTPDALRKSMHTMWSFGVSKEIRFEEGVRKDNPNVKIYTWDPTPIAKETVKQSSAKVIHTAKAFDPSQQDMTFYTIDHKRRCWSLENHSPDKLVDTLTVQTESMESIVSRLGNQVDMIKADIEGRWYELWQGMVVNDVTPKFITIEFEMYFNQIHKEIARLDEIVAHYQDRGYKVYTNRKLPGPHIELCFYHE